MAKGKRDMAREARWRGLLTAHRKSGLSVLETGAQKGRGEI